MKQQEMFGNAKWIGPSPECEAPLMRRDFNAKNCKSAKIIICGLGFFELYLNGKKVTDEILVPAYTDYEDRPNMKLNYPLSDKQSHRILCMEYNLKDGIKDGKNTLGVILGNGWYHQNKHRDEGNVEYGKVKLCFKLDLIDDNGVITILSDEGITWKQSYITSNNIYFGEEHDYRLYDENWATADIDSSWKNVLPAEEPKTEFYMQECPGDKAVEYVTPVLVKDFGTYSVYDAGRNISGFPMVVSEKAGETVSLLCTEEINADQTVNPESCDSIRQPQRDVYITDGSGIEMYPKFTWHGFRYFTLTNNAKPTRCAVVHANIACNSSFVSDNETLNWLYQAYVNSQLTNMHAGVPSDCPHIERLGYTGDGQLCCEAAMMMLDSKAFYRKWMDDIADCQDKNTGHIQHTAPFSGGGGGPGGWGCAIVEVPYIYYKHYGDIEVLKKYLPNMMAYIYYMESRCEGGLVVREEKGGWCLGDWCTKNGMELPEPYVNTYFYIKSMIEVKEIAQILGEPSCIGFLDERIERCRRAITNAYYSEQSHNFIGNVQGANAFAVDLGLGCSDTYRNLVQKYSAHPEFDTGIFGTDILIRILFERGNSLLAYRLLTNENEGSYYNMKKNGATTLWEIWQGYRSHNHPMFGAPVRYLFPYLLGIKQPEESVGYEKIVIEPHFVVGLNRAKGHITTPKGAVSVSYEKNEIGTTVEIILENEMDAIYLFEAQKFELHKGNNKIELQKIVY